jgi:DNA invertase Pin-like site-specific DNA recombinase
LTRSLRTQITVNKEALILKIAYIRVSTVDQSTGRQHDLLQDVGIEKYFEEKASGKDKDREQLQAMLNFAREGDTVYVESISRLARHTRDFLEIIALFNDKGVGFVSLKEAIDTQSPAGKFMLTVFAALSELERDVIRQRQREGIERSLREGRAFGRPKITVNSAMFKSVYIKWKSAEITAVEAMRRLQMKKTSFYKMVKDYEHSAGGGASCNAGAQY